MPRTANNTANNSNGEKMQLTRSGRFLQTGVPRIIQVTGTTSQGQALEGENSNWDSGLGLGKPPQEPTLVGRHLARQRGILGRGKSVDIGLRCEGTSLWLQGRGSEGEQTRQRERALDLGVQSRLRLDGPCS